MTSVEEEMRMGEGGITSLVKVEANRRNAQSSTGPRTPEGKAMARLNALRHGLLSSEVLLKGEQGNVLQALGKGLRAELKPVGELEAILVDRIVSGVWRLKRALRVEAAVMEQNASDVDETNYLGEPYPRAAVARQRLRAWIVDEDTEHILRYETTIERQIYKALHELLRLQAARQGQKPALPLAVDLAVTTEG